MSGQFDQVKRSVEDARRVIDGQELDARRDVAQARQSDQADQAALDAARNLTERVAEVTRAAADTAALAEHRERGPGNWAGRCSGALRTGREDGCGRRGGTEAGTHPTRRYRPVSGR